MMVYDTFLTMENQYMNPNDISENYMRNISRNLKDPSFEILFGANMAMRNPLKWSLITRNILIIWISHRKVGLAQGDGHHK